MLQVDTDGDGIRDGIDEEPMVPSTRFRDGSGTFGEILGNETGEPLIVSDLLDPDGVRIPAGGASGQVERQAVRPFST